jgi:hypothetical protein
MNWINPFFFPMVTLHALQVHAIDRFTIANTLQSNMVVQQFKPLSIRSKMKAASVYRFAVVGNKKRWKQKQIKAEPGSWLFQWPYHMPHKLSPT